MNNHKPSPPALSRVRIEGGEELSRGDLILRGALTAGALYGLGAVSPYMRRALAADGNGDVDILNFLLLFEYLQASLYNRGSRGESGENYAGESTGLSREEKKLVETLLAEEGQHVAALRAMIEELGGKPVEKGKYAFAYRESETFLQIAGELETVAVGAYNGAIPSLESKEAQELANSIVQVEGRHAATVRLGIGEEPAPEAFDTGVSKQTSLNSVVQFTGAYE